MKIKNYRRIFTLIALVAIIIFPFRNAHADNLTSISDTLSTLTQAAEANHTIEFVTPTGVDASTDTIIIDLTDFANAAAGTVDFSDMDLAYDTDGSCGTFSNTKTLAGTPGSSPQWGAAFASLVLTLTPPTDAAAGEIVAGRCVQLLIGTNASGGNAQLENPNDTNTHVFEISGNFNDDGSYAVDFVADDSVNITSTVDPTISFTISDTTIEFGTLASGSGRWADNAAGEPAVQGNLPTEAHQMAIGTNATDGWAITYNGATLTSGSDVICQTPLTDCSDASNDSDGSPGTEQFGISISTDGNSTIPANYQRDTTADFEFIPSTTTTIISESGPTLPETISASYLANITTSTEAGAYLTNITYIATAVF